MLYKDFKGLKLSALGLGTMRLPVNGETNACIDKQEVARMLEYAFANGINYFDTAWRYHQGMSECVIGELLQNYPRDSFYLATKFPGNAKTVGDVVGIFEKQLEKCRVGYFDFYLFHNVCERNIDLFLDPKYGILEYLLEQKKNGRIRHLGFSTHGTMETVNRFLDAYGQHMEFCQIQLNWLDWNLLDAKAKVEMLRSRNIPIWVMEPVRGGRLVHLEEKFEQRLRELRPEASVVEWAFRFLQTVPGVTMTLSGMSNMTQLQQNVETYKTEKTLTAGEWDALLQVGVDMTADKTLPCTACRYCIEACPKKLEIPKLVDMYNEHNFSRGFHAPSAMKALPEEKRPSACIGCRACEVACPQNIKVSEAMAKLAEILQEAE